ncbi:MAG: hypothetical protein IJ222_10540 [Bacteroidales bacterium]|nr:hypothetical protein [Bacteroidales bacterium]
MEKAHKVELQCLDKANGLIDKYFPNFIHEAAIKKPERLAGEYNDELPHKIASEFRVWLSRLWAELAPEGAKPFDEIMNLKKSIEVTDASYAPYLNDARKDAEQITLWEKLTKTNHEDVSYYKGLLKQYTEELLRVMIKDFVGDISEE